MVNGFLISLSKRALLVFIVNLVFLNYINSQQVNIESSDGKFLVFEPHIACLSKVLQDMSYFSDSNNNDDNILSFKREDGDFYIGDENFQDQDNYTSYNSLSYFKRLLKDVLLVKQEFENSDYLIDRLLRYPLQESINCTILAEFLNVPELKEPCARNLSFLLRESEYIENLREKEQVYDNAYLSKAPIIQRLAAFYLLNEDRESFRYLFSRAMVYTDLKGHTRGSEAITCSPDGYTLVTLDSPTNVRLALLADKKKKLGVSKMLRHKRSVATVSFSAKGTRMATATDDGVVYLWKFPQCKRLCTFVDCPDTIKSLCFSPDGVCLAGVSDNRSVFIWNIKEQKLHSILNYESPLCNFIDFNILSTNVITATRTGIIESRSIDSGKTIVALSNEEIKDIECCALHPNKKTIVAISKNCMGYIWDLTQEKLIKKFLPLDPVKKITFSPENTTGSYFVTMAHNGPACLWDISTGEFFASIDNNNINGIVPGEKGEKLIISRHNGRIQKIDISCIRQILNDQELLKKIIFLCLFLSPKRMELDKEKPHIKNLYNSFPYTFKAMLSKKFGMKGL